MEGAMWEKSSNLRHLQAFIEVARCGNISRAAQQVHLSQPAITQAIAKLERELNAALFERSPNGMLLTEPGGLFRRRVQCALSHLQTGASEALRIGGKKRRGGFSHFERLLTAAQLRALIAVSGSGSFSLAARTAGLSQPSVHRAARDLERLSGVPLFEKTGKGIALTEAAQVLVRHSRLAFAELRHGSAEIKEWLGLDCGEIVIGCLPLARTYVLPKALNALAKEKPGIDVRVLTGPYDDLLYRLRHGEIDILVGALRDPAPFGDIVQTAYFHDPLAILARAGHPLTKTDLVTAEDVWAFPWILPPEGTPARAFFEKAFGAARKERPPGVTETSSMVLVRGLLMESDRLTILSAHQMRHEIELGQIVALPVDMLGSARPIGVTVRAGWRPTATYVAFLNHLRAASDIGSHRRLEEHWAL
jgi:DNA-binding transcriptional LysR family regulator